MVARAIENPMYMRESVDRKAWTLEDGLDLFVFLTQSVGLVCAAILIYSLGPALGMALVVGGLAVWSLLGNHSASAKEEEGSDEDNRPPVPRPALSSRPGSTSMAKS